MLSMLANNQKRHNPELSRQIAPTAANQQPESTQCPVSEAAGEETVETTNSGSRLKDSSLPKLVKELGILNSYDVRMMSIISSTKIRNKVQQATQILTSALAKEAPSKPIVVVLTAKQGTASKLITIVEIIKRNLDNAKTSWYQYSRVDPKMIEIKRKPSSASKHVDAFEGDDEGGVAFETMLSAVERKLMEKAKFRAVPVMTIFLSCSSVKKLSDAHGYVSCELLWIRI